jgi:hypothetical protein
MRCRVVRVVLIEIAGLGPTFLAEGDLDEGPPPAGVFGWLAGRRQALLDELERPGTLLGATLGRIWVRLQRLVAPDEHLLRRLRRARSLAIDHPSLMTPKRVESLWGDLLAKRRRKHGTWLVVDGLLAAPSALLAILPGPNLIGYWLLYRAIVHLLAFLGARSGKTIETVLDPHAELDGTVAAGDDGRIAEISAHLKIPEFAALVAAYAPKTRPGEVPRSCD